jgi:3-hydroxyacyl-[acyl-carrier-protein] dehydratase
VGIDKARFRKPVEPGDQLILIVKLERTFKGIYRYSTRAEVGGEEVANAQIMIAPDLRSVPGSATPAELP